MVVNKNRLFNVECYAGNKCYYRVSGFLSMDAAEEYAWLFLRRKHPNYRVVIGGIV